MPKLLPYVMGAWIGGIALGTRFEGSLWPSALFIFGAALLGALWYFGWRAMALLFLLAAVGSGAYWYGAQAQEKIRMLPTAMTISGENFRIRGVPEEKSLYQSVYLQPLSCTGDGCAETGVLWQAPLDRVFAPGARVRLDCALMLPQKFEDFDYQMYLAKERIGYICKRANSVEVLEADPMNKLEHLLYAPRFAFERVLSLLYPEPEAGLSKGLLLGGSSYLSDNLQADFGKLGLSHIVAVSGYNIVLIVQALLFFGIAIGFWRKQAIGFSFLGILFFIFIIGMPASAVRAGLMAGAAFGAFFLGRISYSLTAVLLAAVAMLLYQPLYLWYDAGFQLSFLATLAVIYAMSWYELFIQYQRFGKGLIEIVWLALAVQVFLWPLLVYQFGYISWLALLANVVFLPLVPVAMFCSFAAGLLALLWPQSAMILGWFGYGPLFIITRGTEALAQIPWAVTQAVHLPMSVVILWYTALTVMVITGETYRMRKKYATAFTCPHNHR